MKLRKIVTTIVMAALFLWAPSTIPVRATGVITCGTPVTGLLPIDTAFAGAIGIPLPCPAPPPHALFPWPVLILGLSVTSVILNTTIVWHTQCRELTRQEAWSSIFLPFIGIAFDQHMNKCHRHHH